MSLAPGTRLGAYEILSAIGAGGMGEVYKARDTRLKRSVAIKVLARDLLTLAAARERFHREAIAVAALQHPHICTLHDVGETPEGYPFIVMELLEGETLHQRLVTGPLPVATLVGIGVAVADGLAAAHAAGLVHRDIKPANILLTAHGPKILDFGLAKSVAQATADARAQQPTVAARSQLTDGGSTVGTLSYMSPEQLSGLPLDARTDLFSLGLVFYEMATGRPAFSGATSALISAAILHSAPAPPRQWRPDLPIALEQLILKALEKDPDIRCQSAAEIRADLKRIMRDLDSSAAMASDARLPAMPQVPGTSVAAARSSDAHLAAALVGRHRTLATGAGAAVVVIAALIVWAGWRFARPSARPGNGGQLVQVLSSDLPTSDPALSPDGTTIAYVANDERGRTDLYVTRVAGGARVRLTNDELRESRPRFSPDSETIVFSRRRSDGSGPDICSIPALGGPVSVVKRDAAYPVWSPDGLRIAFVHLAGGRQLLATSRLDGSDTRELITSTAALPFVRNPAWSPDARTVAFVWGSGGIAGDIWLVNADARGTPRRLGSDPAAVFSDDPAFMPDGRTVVHSSNRGGATNIWSMPIDGGPPARLTSGSGPDESPTVDAHGRVAFINSRWRNELLVYGPNGGTARSLARHVRFLWSPAFSPDGQDLAFSRGEVDGSWHVWLADHTAGAPKQLTSTDRGEVYARWTPDGQSLVFHNWSTPRRIWRVPRDGGPAAALTPADRDAAYGDVSPDGRSLAFTITDSADERLYVMTLGDGSRPRLVRPGRASLPRWSPDGRWIVFAPDRSLAGPLRVVRPDGSDERQVTPLGGWPVWWPDGRHIGYLTLRPDETQQLQVVSLDGSPNPTLPSIVYTGVNLPFDISRDGSLATSNAIHTSSEVWVLEPR